MKLIDSDHLKWRVRKKLLAEIDRSSTNKNPTDDIYTRYLQIMLDRFIHEIDREPEFNFDVEQDKYGNISIEFAASSLDIDITPRLWRGIWRATGGVPSVAQFMRADDEKFILTRGVGKKTVNEMLALKDKIREAIEDGKL